MFIIRNRKIFFAMSGALVGLSLLAVAVFGVTFGIDFTGGTIIEMTYHGERPAKADIEAAIEPLELGAFSLRPTNEDGFFLRTRDLSQEERRQVVQALALSGRASSTVERLNAIGPVIGQELRNKAFVAIGAVIVMIILYVAFAFRHIDPAPKYPEDAVSRGKPKPEKKSAAPVSSWKYGIIAIIALLHDILIPVGLFAVLGVTMGAEIDILFVMALLAILGYSVNDTIVVFDRVRENIRGNQERGIEEPFDELVGRSLKQTYVRSINTSLTTLLVLVALLMLGGEPTQFFALTLLAGVIAGTYSSLALATPLLVTMAGEAASKQKAT